MFVFIIYWLCAFVIPLSEDLLGSLTWLVTQTRLGLGLWSYTFLCFFRRSVSTKIESNIHLRNFGFLKLIGPNPVLVQWLEMPFWCRDECAHVNKKYITCGIPFFICSCSLQDEGEGTYSKLKLNIEGNHGGRVHTSTQKEVPLYGYQYVSFHYSSIR